ncbi:rod shape-determining protein MreC [Terriglobus roseus DSM 18391]|uniref:Cell shape-determining protein MreC n=1 Tax=Terriglobus roseus (strain DSM 18391 / NRRL B-41598 / KBS 63) TaxID=926566 RepID=I3ZJS5_TERRK|nr:rod shape-determining protein MreC [Terriglobus roseus]AFL89493.1 rod shape-determining protein MreC [Terriglobus roseus DSM 18391]
MESFFTRFKSELVLLAVLLAQVIGLALQVKRPQYGSREDGHHVRIARAWAAYTVTPIESVLKHSGGGIRGLWHNYIDLRHVRQHDKDLQYQIDQLRLHEAALAEDARQGQRLQRMLAFKQQYVGKTIAAQVVGTGGGDSSRIVTIDKGSADGLKPDMAVITPDGIVGKVRDVFAQSSQILLLNDPSSGAGVLLLTTRTRGILHGGPGGTLMITNLLPDDRIKAGESLITSGGDRVFPRGLPVGTVVSIKPDPEHQPYAIIAIKPASNLDRLEEVLIVTDVAEQLARTNTVADEADEAGKKAAEVVADRLPSLKDPNATPLKPGETAPVATLPKPPPALHTDRYSPGSIPAATSLQPGASNNELVTPPSRPNPTARPAEEQ